MSRWNGLLDAIFLPPRNWVLNNALKFVADLNEVEISKLARCGVAVKDNGEVTVPAGYITDLASVPRIAWAVIAPFDVARAAVIHDVLYGALRKVLVVKGLHPQTVKVLRAQADNVFRKGMDDADPNIPDWKIFSCFWAVRPFGRWAIRKPSVFDN